MENIIAYLFTILSIISNLFRFFFYIYKLNIMGTILNKTTFL